MPLVHSLATVTNPLVEVIVWVYQIWKSLTPEVLVDLVVHAPQYYNKWWSRLLQEAPLHILIETFLICFIVWLVVWNRTEDPKKAKKSILSEKEKDGLIKEWTPEPLVPSLTPRQKALTNSKVVRGAIEQVLLSTSLSACLSVCITLGAIRLVGSPTPTYPHPLPHLPSVVRLLSKFARTATSLSAALQSLY